MTWKQLYESSKEASDGSALNRLLVQVKEVQG